MRKTIKKILLALTLVLILTAVLALSAAAEVKDTYVTSANDPITSSGTVTLLTMDQDGVTKSGYADIDGNPDWKQIGKYSDGQESLAFLNCNAYWTSNCNIYFNETTGTLAVVADNDWSGPTIHTRSGNYPRANTKKTDLDTLLASDPDKLAEIKADPTYFFDSGLYVRVHGIQPWIEANASNITTLEFRADYDGKLIPGCIVQEFSDGTTDHLTSLKEIRYDSTLTFRSSSGSPNDTFAKKPELTTVKYGTFNTDGTFDTDCRDGVVSLCQGEWTVNTSHPLSGPFGLQFTNSTSVSTIEIAAGANATGFVKNAFSGCTGLRGIYIPVGVDFTEFDLSAANIFTNCTDLTVYVNDTTITNFASFTNVTLANHDQYIIDRFADEKMLTADGVSVKIKDSTTASGTNVAARFLFTLDAAKAMSFAKTHSLSAEEVGVIACAKSNYDAILAQSGNNEIVATYTLLTMGNSPAVHNSVITIDSEGKFSYPGKFLPGTNAEKGIYHYSYTLYGISEANYDSEIYAATYIKTTDDRYIVVSYAYDSVEGTKNTMSLYDATLGLYTQGLINLQGVGDDKYLGGVLMSGVTAYGTTESKSHAVDFYFLKNNMTGKEVLVFRRNADVKAEDIAYIPRRDLEKHPKVQFPEKYAAVGTIVVDYGVDSIRRAAFADATAVETIVYPEGLSSDTTNQWQRATYLFYNDPALSKVIWCHYDDNGNSIYPGSDIWGDNAEQTGNLADLRGIENGVFLDHMMEKETEIANLVASKFIANSAENSSDGVADSPAPWCNYSGNNTRMVRMWSTDIYGVGVPEIYTIDLRSSGVNVTELAGNLYTHIGVSGYHFYLPETLETITSGTIRLARARSEVTVHATTAFMEAFEAYRKALNSSDVDWNHGLIKWDLYDAQ